MHVDYSVAGSSVASKSLTQSLRVDARVRTNKHKQQNPLGERRWHLPARCCPRRPRCPHSLPPLARFSCRPYTFTLSTTHSSQNTSLSSTTSVSRSVDRPMQRLSQLNEMATSTPRFSAGSTQKCGRRVAKCVLASYPCTVEHGCPLASTSCPCASISPTYVSSSPIDLHQGCQKL